MKRLTTLQLISIYHEYQCGNIGKNLRFGQYIINTYFPANTNPELYYEKNHWKALSKLLSNPHYCSDAYQL